MHSIAHSEALLLAFCPGASYVRIKIPMMLLFLFVTCIISLQQLSKNMLAMRKILNIPLDKSRVLGYFI